MSKKHQLTPDEQAEFREAVGPVTPLNAPERHQAKIPGLKPIYKRREPPSDLEPHTLLERQDPVDGEERLFFARSGLQHKLLQNMKRGNLAIEASLDLHGLTIDEATTMTHEFMHECCQQGKRWICLVHGKGHYSPSGIPLLKNWANEWLRTHPQVLAFHSAKPSEGGTGALYILLKRKGK